MPEEKKIATVKMDGSKISVVFDTDKDGEPCADINIYSLEGLQEAFAAIMNIFKKK